MLFLLSSHSFFFFFFFSYFTVIHYASAADCSPYQSYHAASALKTETHTGANGKLVFIVIVSSIIPLILLLLLLYSDSLPFYSQSFFLVPSCTTSLTMCPIRPMWVVLCGPHTATVNDSSVCEGRHGSIHPSEPTNLPTWSQANLVKEPPGELHNRQTYCSHLLLFVVCCRFGTEVRHKNDEGRQQATSRAGAR